MKIIIAFIFMFLGTFALNACAQFERDSLVQSELDYFDHNKNNALTEVDIRNTFEPYYDQHLRIVNLQMDQVERGPLPQAPQEKPQNKEEKSVVFNFKDRVHTFSISSQVFYSRYSEPQKTRTIDGGLGGVDGRYVFRPDHDSFGDTSIFNFYSFESLYATGKNKLYENEQRFSDGSITKLVLKDIPGYVFENRFLLGRDFVSSPSLRLTPYTGFGIRYKSEQSADHYNVYDNYLGSPVVAIGYDFSDLYYYLPIGLTLDLATKNNYEVSLNMEYDYLIKGYERDDYANLDQYTLPTDGFTNQNFRYFLDHGWGGRTSLKFLQHLSSVDIYIEPYIRYWHISASKITSGMAGGGEYIATANKNTTVEVGSSLGVQF